MKLSVVSILIFGILLFSACSTSTPSATSQPAADPSEEVSKTAINVAVKKGLPLNGLGSSWNTVEAKIVSVEILRRGEFNEAQKYWPVQAKVSGTARQEWKISWAASKPSRNCQFNFTEDFRILKNDYEDWVAQKPDIGENSIKLKCDK